MIIKSKIIALVSLTLFTITFATASASAQQNNGKNPTPAPGGENIIDKLKQIEILKEKIATKVAQIRESEKGARLGTIKELKENTITLITKGKEEKITLNEDTLYYKITDGNKKEASHNDIKNSLTISAFGYFNQLGEPLQAKFIFIQEIPARLAGKIADLNKSDYTLTVKTKDGNQIIDFEKYTKTTLFQPGKGKSAGGFSKFNLNDSVFIAADPHENEENRYHALRILQISNPQIIPSETATPSATPKP